MANSIQSLLVLLFLVDMALMLTVGGRLLWVAARTRRAPEAAIGTSAAFGAIGVALSIVATGVLEREPGAFPIWAVGRVFVAIGVGGLTIGTWRIYRPDDTWAAAFAACVCALAFSGCAMRTLTGFIAPPQHAGVGALVSILAALAAYGWGTFEAFHYYGQLRRRLRLGLADPVAAQRFRLWGISGACAFGSYLTSFLMLGLGRALAETPVAFIPVQLALFSAAVCLWLAFFPPSFYGRRLSSRAAG